MMTAVSSQAHMHSVARPSMQPVFRASPLLTPGKIVSGSRLSATKASGRCRQGKRQVLTRAADGKNPIEKAQQAVKDFGDEIKSNSESTAEKTEDAYQQANPEDNEEKPPTETYRSTELKNSKEKYTPKSDPKNKHHKKDMLQEELLETFLNGPFWLLSFFCFLAGTVTGIVEV